MPIYEYQCQQCEHRSEVLQRMADDPLTTCERCGGALKKLLSAPAFQFKGSGWYVTDYARKDADKGGGTSGKESSSSGGSEGGSSSDGSSSAGEGSSKDSSSKDGAASKDKSTSKDSKESKSGGKTSSSKGGSSTSD